MLLPTTRTAQCPALALAAAEQGGNGAGGWAVTARLDALAVGRTPRPLAPRAHRDTARKSARRTWPASRREGLAVAVRQAALPERPRQLDEPRPWHRRCRPGARRSAPS